MNSKLSLEEVIVYSRTVKKVETVTVQKHIPSSWDIADREYGWTREDYSVASRPEQKVVTRTIFELVVFNPESNRSVHISQVDGKTYHELSAILKLELKSPRLSITQAKLSANNNQYVVRNILDRAEIFDVKNNKQVSVINGKILYAATYSKQELSKHLPAHINNKI
ncbi:hypothetical protein HOK51_01890 [Candidatus Woesearchaeota archaeon]|jgi:hypothetical protein|nr:hypothetical protein [Candidatus Woesearchaeota archaeon]MBT6518567.1 hypothetical protein [Candidatus Woesearchaeota archaeon]MBT7366909.1 hypothetical protein [Candidatus Woesearchaeota archaeon]